MRPASIHRIKQTLWKYTPALFYLARFIRRSLHEQRERRIARELPSIRRRFIERHGCVVQGGPFQGMRYIERSCGSAFLPKLVGSYEEEVQPFVERAVGTSNVTVVDIGCAEGYYAVGLARRMPQATVYAFDIDTGAQATCRELAELNGVEGRIVVRGECTPAALRDVVRPGAFVVCDCEGYEFELLDPSEVPALRHADILVELHDHVRLDVAMTPAILARFRDSHDVTLVANSARDVGRYPCLSFLPARQRAFATHEERMPVQQWAFLRAR